MEKCKRCLLIESAQKDVYDDIHKRIDALPEKDKADDELYRSRTDKCRQCDFLLAGVCQKCGCYIEFRAAFKNQHCPLTKNNKQW